MRRNRGQVMYMPKDGKVNEMPNPKTAEEIFAERIVELEAELAALKEQYRWRDENMEPAPRGERVLVYCIDYDASDGIYDAEMEHMYCPDGELAYPYTWWRPLDLPEMGETK